MNSIETLTTETLSKMKAMMDITTIVGTPIILDNNTTIIPISKASIGLVVGGGEIDNHSRGNYPFTGGTGAGINLTPSGFLVYNNGNWEFCKAEIGNEYSEIFNAVSSLIKAFVGEEDNENQQDSN